MHGIWVDINRIDACNMLDRDRFIKSGTFVHGCQINWNIDNCCNVNINISSKLDPYHYYSNSSDENYSATHTTSNLGCPQGAVEPLFSSLISTPTIQMVGAGDTSGNHTTFGINYKCESIA